MEGGNPWRGVGRREGTPNIQEEANVVLNKKHIL